MACRRDGQGGGGMSDRYLRFILESFIWTECRGPHRAWIKRVLVAYCERKGLPGWAALVRLR